LGNRSYFFYYKPKLMAQSIGYLMLNPSAHSSTLSALVIAGFVNFLVFLVITARVSTRFTLRLTGLGALFAISTIPPYLVAWGMPHTTADLLFYWLFCFAVGLAAVVQAMRAGVRRTPAARATLEPLAVGTLDKKHTLWGISISRSTRVRKET
jgi:hypothetical protein